MKGASGAHLSMRGDFVEKCCEDAGTQVEWFRLANMMGFASGVGTPRTSLGMRGPTTECYLMEFVSGHTALHDTGTWAIRRMLAQALRWQRVLPATTGTWDDYITRLEDHTRHAQSKAMSLAQAWVEDRRALQTSFCHGDMTLENAIVRNGTEQVVLIDPNFKDGLFQSFSLDLGKLLQSTHAKYHSVFQDIHVDLRRHDLWLQKQLRKRDLWDDAYTALVSHVMRFRKYRPSLQHSKVDDLLIHLIQP